MALTLNMIRLPDLPDGDLPVDFDEETQWVYWKTTSGTWYANIPSIGLANLAGHQVVEHDDDGTITASPSILVSGHRGSRHGFLEHGMWRDV